MGRKSHKCLVCQKNYHLSQGTYLKNLATEIAENVQNDYPSATERDFLCLNDLMKYKIGQIEQQLNSDSKQIEETNSKIMESIKNGEFICDQALSLSQQKSSFGEQIADKVAKFGGSWTFILLFLAFITVWMAINTFYLLTAEHFDPYPFILLNLILSCLAAIQAPVVMMSQNRQEKRDRQQSKNDYHVNLKAEIEIRLLHEKLDYLLTKQMKHLHEMQNIQISLLDNLSQEVKESKKHFPKPPRKPPANKMQQQQNKNYSEKKSPA